MNFTNFTNFTTLQPTQSPTSNQTFDTNTSTEADYLGYYVIGTIGAVVLCGFASAAIYYSGCYNSLFSEKEPTFSPKIPGDFVDINLG